MEFAFLVTQYWINEIANFYFWIYIYCWVLKIYIFFTFLKFLLGETGRQSNGFPCLTTGYARESLSWVLALAFYVHKHTFSFNMYFLKRLLVTLSILVSSIPLWYETENQPRTSELHQTHTPTAVFQIYTNSRPPCEIKRNWNLNNSKKRKKKSLYWL